MLSCTLAWHPGGPTLGAMDPDRPSAASSASDPVVGGSGAVSPASNWMVPRPVLIGALKIAVILIAPLVIAYLTFGNRRAALAVAMGYTGSLTPALRLRSGYSLALVVPAAMTGVVAPGIGGQALPAACFVALACLLVAPANVVQNGLLAGIPTIAAVYATLPDHQDPTQVGAWMLVGGAIVVVSPPAPGCACPPNRSASSRGRRGPMPWRWPSSSGRSSWSSAPWTSRTATGTIAMTMTVVLRPYGPETQTVARQRVVGTTLGAVLALGLALPLPTWAALVVAVALLVLMVANALLGRYAQQVTFLTPLIVLLGSAGGDDAVGVALDRVVATLVGAVLATVIALALWRVDRRVSRPDRSRRGGAPTRDRVPTGARSVAGMRPTPAHVDPAMW